MAATLHQLGFEVLSGENRNLRESRASPTDT
jgi:hypothetical protein